jgi:hypothetical protein
MFLNFDNTSMHIYPSIQVGSEYTYGWLKKKRELSEKVLADFIKFL